MKKLLINLILTFAGIELVFAFMFTSAKTAILLLVLFLVLLVPILFIRQLFLNNWYKSSIRIAPKQYVFNQYTLINDHCIVKYTPDEKITVSDNVAVTKRRELRTFTLKKSSSYNVNKGWNQICKLFDSFVSLDSLVCFFNFETNVDVKTVRLTQTPEDKKDSSKDIQIDTTHNGPKFVDINSVRPDTYMAGMNVAAPDGGNFVNIDNIKEAPKTSERNIPEPDFIEMGEILSSESKTIDVNNSSASQIALLPGINIIMAKKIVEYRDANGFFKTVDDFLKVANVKEHFISKIKSAIVIGEPPAPKNDDDNDEGRIIDF